MESGDFFHFLCPILNAVLRKKSSYIIRIFGAEKRNILSLLS